MVDATSVARAFKLQSLSIRIRVSHETGVIPFPCNQYWNMARQHDSTPARPLSASIWSIFSPAASNLNWSPMSFHL